MRRLIILATVVIFAGIYVGQAWAPNVGGYRAGQSSR